MFLAIWSSDHKEMIKKIVSLSKQESKKCKKHEKLRRD